MKININVILTALVALLSFAGVSSGQSHRLTFPDAVINNLNSGGQLFTEALYGEGKKVKIDFVKTSKDTVEAIVNYTGLESPGSQIVEAVLPASSHEACLASRDFSRAVPVGPDRATFRYDPQTATGTLSWFLARNDSASCRVLLVRSSSDSGDYAVWRTNFGQTVSSSADAEKSDLGLTHEAAPQRSSVTSFVVTFDRVIDPAL
jgi:hypothetical protein